MSEYITRYFVSKELVRTAKGKDGKPDFKVFKLHIKKNLEDQYPTKISCPEWVKGFDTLEEGEVFTVGYNLSDPIFNAKAGKEIQYKNAFFIKPDTADNIGANESSTTQTTIADATPKIPTKESLLAFHNDWFEMYRDSGREHTEKDFILTYFANEYNELYVVLKEFYGGLEDEE